MHVDVVAVTAMEKERTALLNYLNAHKDSEQSENDIELPVLPGMKVASWTQKSDSLFDYEIFDLSLGGFEPGLRVAVCPSIGKGPLAAALSCSKIFRDLTPKLTVLLGIAGCMKPMKSSIELGDVGIAYHGYDISAGKFEGGKIVGDWTAVDYCVEMVRLVEDRFGKKVAEADNFIGSFTINYGTFLCSPFVLADKAYKEELIVQTQNRNLIGIEMEAAGVGAAVDRHGLNNFMMIKGFSDYAGVDKETETEPDQENERLNVKERMQTTAAYRSAYVFLRMLNELGEQISRLNYAENANQSFSRQTKQVANGFVNYSRSAPGFWESYCNSITRSYSRELVKLKACVSGADQFFESHIDTGTQFLLRARSLYENARCISAVSVDAVSKFWLSAGTKTLSRNFIDCQYNRDGSVSEDCEDQSVFRLFVFSSPESAHQHVRRLDYHATKFSNTLICSLEHYERIVRKWANSLAELNSWLVKDFVFLDYEHDNSYFGTLSETKITLRRLGDIEREPPLLVERFNEFVAACRDLKPGDTSEIFGATLLKWIPGYWESDEESRCIKWADCLEKMFEKKAADVFHLFGFCQTPDNNFPIFRQWLTRIKTDALHARASNSILGKRNVKSLTLTKKVDHNSVASRSNDSFELFYPDEPAIQNLVAIRFPHETDLQQWFLDEKQIDARFELYADLVKSNPEISSILSDNGIAISSPHEIRELEQNQYEFLEKTLGIWRLDVRDDEMFEQLAASEPPEF